MPSTPTMRVSETELFFRRWLSSPRSVGSVRPSSQALARAIARAAIVEPGDFVVELGGGTGAITQGLIDYGIARDRIVVVELDPKLADFLEHRLPGCRVLCGDATRLDAILANAGVERVGTVISGLPMVGNPVEFRCAIVRQAFKVLRPGGTVLQYGYSPISVVPTRKLGIRAHLADYVFWNLPPAAVWRYELLQ